MERLSNFLKGTQLVNGQAGFKPDGIGSEIQFFNIVSILYNCGGVKGGYCLRTVSHVSLREEAQSTPLHKGRVRQDFSLAR